MSQNNGHRAVEELETTTEIPQPRLDEGLGGLNNLVQAIPFGNLYFGLWNRYINTLVESQQFFMRANQWILQAYGIPTAEDMARINRQLFEVFDRLDELENRLDRQGK